MEYRIVTKQLESGVKLYYVQKKHIFFFWKIVSNAYRTFEEAQFILKSYEAKDYFDKQRDIERKSPVKRIEPTDPMPIKNAKCDLYVETKKPIQTIEKKDNQELDNQKVDIEIDSDKIQSLQYALKFYGISATTDSAKILLNLVPTILQKSGNTDLKDLTKILSLVEIDSPAKLVKSEIEEPKKEEPLQNETNIQEPNKPKKRTENRVRRRKKVRTTQRTRFVKSVYVSEIGFSARAITCFQMLNIETLEDLYKWNATELMNQRGVGEKTLQSIQDILYSLNLPTLS